MQTREHGKISKVMYGNEDHGILTCQLWFESTGAAQCFGGLVLDERTGPAFMERLCKLFGVADLEKITDCYCWALRCFPTFNTPIEGLENMIGDRFTITGFRREMWPEPLVDDPYTAEVRRLTKEIANHKRRIEELLATRSKLHDGYVDWVNAPRGTNG